MTGRIVSCYPQQGEVVLREVPAVRGGLRGFGEILGERSLQEGAALVPCAQAEEREQEQPEPDLLREPRRQAPGSRLLPDLPV